ncbi:MAG: hypothetical protein ACFFED_03770 [Candidatus Thorarchaeota archaeon]
MKPVTVVLQILSIVLFFLMCLNVYLALEGYWNWNAPYVFIVTVFRLISLILFFVGSMVIAGLVAPFTGFTPSEALVGLYNTQLLRMWYMQPYGVSGPFTSIRDVFSSVTGNFGQLWTILSQYSFNFMFFLAAALGIVFFLQSLFRFDHKFVGGAFISIQSVLVIAAVRATVFPLLPVIPIPEFASGSIPPDFFEYLFDNAQIIALISFAYLEISYQMIYSHSVGKPVEEREDTLKKQLLALRQVTRKKEAIEKGEKISTTAMSRSSGATAFSFLREAIERRVFGESEVVESLDAIADVRRLQIFVDELLSTDPNARDELTAKAAAPSSAYIISSTISGSIIRFLGVITIAFLFVNPLIFTTLFSLPPGIQNSVELEQPELVILFLLPILLVFVLVAMIIGWATAREVEEKPAMSKEEKEAENTRKTELKKKRADAKKARKEREMARKKRKDSSEPVDEWDRALEETYKT